jgi:hypothetical protein
MITPNALAPDVSLASMAAMNPDTTSTPTPISSDAQPPESFAKLMGDTMSDQGRPQTASTASPTKPTKDDKKDKGTEKTTAATTLPGIAMTMPIPPSPLPKIEKIPTAAVKAPAATNIPSPAVQVANVAVNTKSDASAVAVAASVVPVLGDLKAAPVAVSKPINKETPEIKTSSQTEGKSTTVTASKSPSADMSSDDSSAHHEDRQQPQQSSPAPLPVSMAVQTPAGTGTAKQVAAMKLQEKVEGNTRTAEKNLPHGSFLPDSGRNGAVEASSPVTVVPQAVGTQGTTTSSTAVNVLVGVVHDNTGVVDSQTHIQTVRSPQVDKVLTEVSESVVSFKRIGAESVDVNLQPDRGTEISLHLSLTNGQVEVAARLDRGNFDSLNTHWSDLQQSLAQQGIRVGQLEHSSLNQNPEGSQNRNQATFTQTMQQETGGQRQRSSGPTTETLDVPTHAATPAAPQRARNAGTTNPARRGWEMWA